jgi:transposase
MQSGRRRIKKTPSADGGSYRRSVGYGRGALPATWLALPDVDSTGNQGPCSAARSHAAQRGILWRSAASGREVFLPPRDRQIQWPHVLRLHENLRRTSIRTGRRVVVITDNAKYHHGRLHKPWREQHTLDFALDYLPPYSPELNPIERVWKLTRRLCLHNQYFPSLSQVIDSIENEFQQWTHPNEILRRLCALT